MELILQGRRVIQRAIRVELPVLEHQGNFEFTGRQTQAGLETVAHEVEPGQAHVGVQACDPQRMIVIPQGCRQLLVRVFVGIEVTRQEIVFRPAVEAGRYMTTMQVRHDPGRVVPVVRAMRAGIDSQVMRAGRQDVGVFYLDRLAGLIGGQRTGAGGTEITAQHCPPCQQMLGRPPGGIPAVGGSTAAAATPAHTATGAVDRALSPVACQGMQGHRGLLTFRRQVESYRQRDGIDNRTRRYAAGDIEGQRRTPGLRWITVVVAGKQIRSGAAGVVPERAGYDRTIVNGIVPGGVEYHGGRMHARRMDQCLQQEQRDTRANGPNDTAGEIAIWVMSDRRYHGILLLYRPAAGCSGRPVSFS